MTDKRVRALLWCGIASSVLYVAINIIVPLQWEGYSMLSNVPSELSAIDSPTRTLWNVLCTPYTPLMMLFGWGVWRAAGHNRRLRLSGAAIFAYGALGIGWPFVPMHMRDVIAAGGGTLSDTLHLVFAGVTVLLMWVAMGFGAAAISGRFRAYTFASIGANFVFGMLTFGDSRNIDKGLPTPFIGLWERINIAVFLLWVVVLAVVLLRRVSSAHGDPRRAGAP